jgi:hypothetical protein
MIAHTNLCMTRTDVHHSHEQSLRTAQPPRHESTKWRTRLGEGSEDTRGKLLALGEFRILIHVMGSFSQ